ncbi:nitrogenase iron-molybdenum cofactor biosynthesis protein NifN [Aneurinibacillus terranovensis]|uniref:nitrogenase iron-molybdenum cofactor biosynthesis protein NifN n=1 Tax=Aneurinibacillus terranovensis TaxID=278991 RepID=UPI000482823A|nr:nitrogenase iron-molybdenum cofactor biosynthesis protein NifN [Aneurinibacillus terranovensis]
MAVTMTVKKKNKSVSINPLKISQPLGGTIALQGFYRSIPIIHGSQGCAAFIKSLMTRHYREPIAIQTSALQEMNVIFGADRSLKEALERVIAKHNPDIVALFSTSLTEVAGDDIQGTIKEYVKNRPPKNRLIVPVSLPDFQGSLESGYSQTVEAIILSVIRETSDRLRKKKVRNRINLLPGSHLTPGDVMELKEIISAFGFEVITIPDLSASLSGHLLTGFSPLSRGGVSLDYLFQMVTAGFTIAVGSSMERAAKKLKEFAGIPYRIFPSLIGLQANDEFFRFLDSIKMESFPLKYLLQRENLLDSMLDAHFYSSEGSAVAALEPDHLYSIWCLLKELGIGIQGLVTSMKTPILDKIDDEVWIGDFEDVEELAEGANLWISNSHGRQGATRKQANFISIGFPVFDRLGASLFTSIGYRGTTEMVIKIGNELIRGEGEL